MTCGSTGGERFIEQTACSHPQHLSRDVTGWGRLYHLCANRRSSTHTFKHRDSDFTLSSQEILSSLGSWGKFFPIATMKAHVSSVFAASNLVACLFFSFFTSSGIHSQTHLFCGFFSPAPSSLMTGETAEANLVLWDLLPQQRLQISTTWKAIIITFNITCSMKETEELEL